MKRVLFYALVAVVAGGSLAAEPTWAQKRGSDEGGRQKGDKEGRQGGKKGQKDSRRGKAKKSSPLQQITQAMQQELNLSEEQIDQIRTIIQEFKSSGDDGDRESSKGERQEMASRLRELQDEARKANKDGDRERARELMQESRELMRESRGSSDKAELDPKMFDAIAKVLDDNQRPKFRRIVERHARKEKGDPGAAYLALLQGLNLTDEQGPAIARFYKTYLDDLKKVDQGDRQAAKQVQHSFEEAVRDQLTKEQQAALEQSLKNSKNKSRAGGKSGGKNRGREGKGQKGGKGAKGKPSQR